MWRYFTIPITKSLVSLGESKNYTVSILDGDMFKKDPTTVGFSQPPQKPIDLFVM